MDAFCDSEDGDRVMSCLLENGGEADEIDWPVTDELWEGLQNYVFILTEMQISYGYVLWQDNGVDIQIGFNTCMDLVWLGYL